MSTKTEELNKKIARQSFEAIMNNNYKLLETITDSKKFSMYFSGNKAPLDYSGTVKIHQGNNAAFPDAQISIEKQISQGEYVTTFLKIFGTNTGVFHGMDGTGKTMKTNAIIQQRIKKGKITEEWIECDNLGILQQIGILQDTEIAAI